ncbi:PF20097 family protein [Mucisphaera calidilacus]|uniref:DUF6487 domain-containing protein n=1 Tax=Mucisphaera calidilacus TaxID=2527982 RepID=A0A518BW03_9BACT|nr:PF20097 family protein [Mucisphaera calidilacus]QDU71159.1 hypothetical protein Pan265_10080 [Mucisphaera calidilacus]
MASHVPEPEVVRCPKCHARMQPGVLPVSGGIGWLPWSPSATMSMSESLPGTHAVMRPNRLPGWRCRACELVLFRYGHKVPDPIGPADELPEAPLDEDTQRR